MPNSRARISDRIVQAATLLCLSPHSSIERVTVDLDRLVHRARRREEALREEESGSESGEE